MSRTAPSRQTSQQMSRTEHHAHLTLNTDGRRHPRQNALALLAVLGSLTAVVCAFLPTLHVIGFWAGIVGIASAGAGQYISDLTSERWVYVISLIGCGMGVAFALVHGGPL